MARSALSLHSFRGACICQGTDAPPKTPTNCITSITAITAKPTQPHQYNYISEQTNTIFNTTYTTILITTPSRQSRIATRHRSDASRELLVLFKFPSLAIPTATRRTIRTISGKTTSQAVLPFATLHARVKVPDSEFLVATYPIRCAPPHHNPHWQCLDSVDPQAGGFQLNLLPGDRVSTKDEKKFNLSMWLCDVMNWPTPASAVFLAFKHLHHQESIWRILVRCQSARTDRIWHFGPEESLHDE
ncbi:hypothetical protein MY3296_004772 [Beauveria thailandica]